MARSRVLQASIKGELERNFDAYQAKEKLTDAEAVRELLNFALRIKMNQTDDGRPSNRELLEEIYRVTRQSSAIGDIIHGQTFDGEKLFKEQKESKPLRKQVKADIDDQVNAFLTGKNKRS